MPFVNPDLSGDPQNGGDPVEQQNSSCPFSIRLLGPGNEYAGNGSGQEQNQLLALLPATYRTETGDLAAAGRHATSCLEKELALQRLTNIHGWLWFAGLPKPPRPLHHQLLSGREIVITEQMDMHLAWTTGRLFVKPLPRYLLEPRFWAEYLSCPHGCGCIIDVTQTTAGPCRTRRLRRCALGFLFSYAALVSHESDFRIAHEKQLLPPELLWPAWRVFIDQLDLEHIYPRIDPRFYHGELRLSRLNVLYAVLRTPFSGYVAHWDRYSTFIRDNFSWLAGTTVYIAVVLTAMQVGLATESLAHNSSFQSASYGFTIFSILGPLILTTLIILSFSCVFVSNVITALQLSKRRITQFMYTGELD